MYDEKLDKWKKENPSSNVRTTVTVKYNVANELYSY